MATMFKYQLKRAFRNIAYLHMFKYQLKRAFYIIAYLHMFRDCTSRLTMVKVGGWRSQFQSLSPIKSSLP